MFTHLAETEQDTDEFHHQFLGLEKGKKITMLQAALKAQIFLLKDQEVKLNYIKKSYAEQSRQLHSQIQENAQVKGQVATLELQLENSKQGLATNKA